MVPDTTPLSLNPEFRRGVDLFNREEFYECHEVLEDVWRPTQSADRIFLQALIHFAVGFYHYQQGNSTGAELQLWKALRKLAGYLPAFHGVDTARLYCEGFSALEEILAGRQLESFPRFQSRQSSI